ncbi:hypothetical protein [Actinomadura sp. 7K507]|nr:hypothetical protein [Actinomadura sp. 7K507]
MSTSTMPPRRAPLGSVAVIAGDVRYVHILVTDSHLAGQVASGE